MKKFIAIGGLLALVLTFILIVPHKTIPIKNIWIPDKNFNSGGYLRSYIQINPDTIKVAEDLITDSEQQSVINAYDWLEKNYHYVPDNNISFSDGVITIKVNGDYWQEPLLSLSIIKQTGGFYGDCEDGAFLLTSVLNAMGYKDVYCEIGTVTLPSGVYGHAWVVWKDYLLETVRGKPLFELKKLPDFYSPQFKFNYWKTYQYYGGKGKSFPTLNNKQRQELIQQLGG